jgi:hypothetical protein
VGWHKPGLLYVFLQFPMNVIPETRRAHKLDIYLFLLLLSKLTQHKESHHQIFHSHWFTHKENSGKVFKEIYQQNEISNDSLVQESMNYGRYTVMIHCVNIERRNPSITCIAIVSAAQ